MPATCTQSASQALDVDGIATATGYAGNKATICFWLYLPASQSNHAYAVAETVNNADASSQRFGIRVTGTNVILEFWQDSDGSGGSSGSFFATSGVSISTGVWHFIYGERDGDTLRLWVDDTEQSSPDASTTGVGTTNFRTAVGEIADCLNIFRSPSGINLGQGGLSVTLARLTGSIAFVAGFQGVLSRTDRTRLWNGGVPNRRNYYDVTSATMAYLYSLSSRWPAYRGHSTLSVNSNSPTFTQTRSVEGWETSDPFSLDISMFDSVGSCVAFWPFQEAPNGSSSAFVDRINGVTLVHDGVTGNNGAASNIVRAGDGVFGEHSLSFGTTGIQGTAGDSYGLWVPPDDSKIEIVRSIGNRRGVTVMAWVKPKHDWAGTSQMGLVGGIWDEQAGDDGQRKYALFMQLRDINDETIHPAPFTVNGHVSTDGGITPGQSFNYDVSYTGKSWTPGYWSCMAMTWDPDTGQVSSFLDGVPYPSPRNPYAPGYKTLHNSVGAFRVGGVGVSDGGGQFGNYVNSYMGGLAVFDRTFNPAMLQAAMVGQDPDEYAAGAISGGWRNWRGSNR